MRSIARACRASRDPNCQGVCAADARSVVERGRDGSFLVADRVQHLAIGREDAERCARAQADSLSPLEAVTRQFSLGEDEMMQAAWASQATVDAEYNVNHLLTEADSEDGAR